MFKVLLYWPKVWPALPYAVYSASFLMLDIFDSYKIPQKLIKVLIGSKIQHPTPKSLCSMTHWSDMLSINQWTTVIVFYTSTHRLCKNYTVDTRTHIIKQCLHKEPHTACVKQLCRLICIERWSCIRPWQVDYVTTEAFLVIAAYNWGQYSRSFKGQVTWISEKQRLPVKASGKASFLRWKASPCEVFTTDTK